MSEGPDTTGPELPDDEAFAAEHALGVLTAAERASAELRMARDPGFAAHVDAWRERLAPMLDAIAPVMPPPGLWPRIERGLPANDNAGRGLRFWRGAAMGSMGLAAPRQKRRPRPALSLAGRPRSIRGHSPAGGSTEAMASSIGASRSRQASTRAAKPGSRAMRSSAWARSGAVRTPRACSAAKASSSGSSGPVASGPSLIAPGTP
jgi:hypothetical protein